MDAGTWFQIFDELRQKFGLSQDEALNLLNEGLDRAEERIQITDKGREYLKETK